MPDKVLVCKQCGQEFAWTEDEQDFFFKKGLKPPARCMFCRAALKKAKKDKFRGRIKIFSKDKEKKTEKD
jgi:hypothetical protein